jgi:hypothetical protein
VYVYVCMRVFVQAREEQVGGKGYIVIDGPSSWHRPSLFAS